MTKMIRLTIFCAIFSLALFQEIFAQSFSGVYQIGPSAGAAYSNINSAVTALKSGTVNGPVTFELEAATFNETVNLSSLNNGGFTFTLKGQGELTIIHPLSDIASDKAGISLANTSNVVLKDFALVMDDISAVKVNYDGDGTRGIYASNATDISFENLKLSNDEFVSSELTKEYIASAISLNNIQQVSISSSDISGAGILIYIDDYQDVTIGQCDFSRGQVHIYNMQGRDTSADGLTIDNNTFTGPFPTGRSAGAIYLFGHSPNFLSSSFASNLVVQNNNVDAKIAGKDDASYGMYINIQVEPVIRKNIVEDGCFGIFLGGSTNSLFELNEVYRTANEGLHLQNGGSTDIVNNIVTSSYTPVSAFFTSNVRLAHNTLYATGDQPTLRILGVSGDSLKVMNNIFEVQNLADYEVIYSDVTANNITIDNNLYSGNANTHIVKSYRLGGNSGVFYDATSLSDWQSSQSFYDQNSQSFQPSFAGSDDFHIVNNNYRFGTFVDDIISDIDGDPRSQSTGIDVGADQSTVVVSAPTITSFSPANGPIGTILTISGTDFDNDASNNKVVIGGVEALVTSASSTQLVASVPAGVTYGKIKVLTNGLIAESVGIFQVTFDSDRTLASNSFKIDLTVATGAESVLSLTTDLDLDSKNDMVIANATDQTISIYRNLSSGIGDINIDVRQDLAILGRPGEILYEDFDGDGDLDLAIGYVDNTHISIFRNISSGGINFDARLDFDVATNNTYGIAAGDLDADGKADLVFVDNQSDQVIVLKNGSTHSVINFTSISSYATGDNPVSVAIADMDQDLIPDVIVANQTGMNLSILVNDGAMNLAAKSDFAVGGEPTQIMSADIDGDQITDLVSVSNVTLSNPNGRFTVLRNMSSPGSLSFLGTNLSLTGHRGTLGDYNGDGKLDIASIHIFNGLSLIENTSTIGNVNFEQQKMVVSDVQPLGVMTADIDLDGEPDIVLSGVSSDFKNEAEIFRNLSASTDILSFSVPEESSPAVLDLDNHTINLGITDCSDILRLIPSFSTSFGASTYLLRSATDSILQVSGATENDFSGPFTYTMIGEDGETAQDWVVNVTGARYSDLIETDIETCDNYQWHGTVYTESGTYQELFTNTAGCDSTEVLHLTILESTAGDMEVESCGSYEWQGTLYESSGTYQEVLTNSVGCDSTATLNLTILEPSFGDQEVESCGSYEWQGTLYESSGTYQEVLTNSVGCDSTATLNLTIMEPSSGDQEVESCGSYEWQGTLYESSGTYQEVLTNSVGCDSTATLNLTILESSFGNQEVESCGSYEWQGTLYESSGTYQEVLTNSLGCDSTATLNLTILESSFGNHEVESCGSYEWQGTLYESSGTYQEVLRNSVGCDSTATLNLTILESSFGNQEVESCGSYEWQGTLYESSGTYQEVLTNSVGCDSTATLNLTILESSFWNQEVEACESYEWLGTIYSTSGSYQELLTNALGCDSVATLNLTILNSTFSQEEVMTCESYTWNDQVYSTSGFHEVVLTNEEGCDSLAILDLTILESSFSETQVNVCNSYEWNGDIYDTSGIYEIQLTNSVGCDSLAILDLTIHAEEITELVLDACGSFDFGSQFITASGLYQETFENRHGCDSTVLMNLSILQASESEINQSGASLIVDDLVGNVTYQWINCETKEEFQGATERSFTPESNGQYAVIVSNGVCDVISDCFAYERSTVVLSSDRSDRVGISLFPNPTNEMVHVDLDSPNTVEVSLIALDGKVLSKKEYEPTEDIILWLPKPGIYMVHVTEEETGQSSLFRVSRIE